MSAPREADFQSEASRVAHVLGLPRWKDFDDLKLVESVNKGIPASAVERIVFSIDPRGRFLQVTDIIPKSTYHRRLKNKQPLSKDESERILALSKVIAEVLLLYKGETELAAHFLSRKHPMLGGRSPLDMANESIAGAGLVMKLLAQADAGVAV
jgi:putative toxin-antitoxin system antitoxin component (TIGR02293 family)